MSRQQPNHLAFTSRELDVLRLLVSGRSNRRIGTTLQITERTVRFHLSNIFVKLDVSNRVEAVSNVIQLGVDLTNKNCVSAVDRVLQCSYPSRPDAGQ